MEALSSGTPQVSTITEVRIAVIAVTDFSEARTIKISWANESRIFGHFPESIPCATTEIAERLDSLFRAMGATVELREFARPDSDEVEAFLKGA